MPGWPDYRQAGPDKQRLPAVVRRWLPPAACPGDANPPLPARPNNSGRLAVRPDS